MFIVSGGYKSIRKALVERGWYRNKDPKSNCFDLKWVLKGKHIDHRQLEEGQTVNHFFKSTSITTKIGICRSMKDLVNHTPVDPDTFFPICFDLSDPDDFESFKEQYMVTKAEAIVKRFYANGEKLDEKLIKVALDICERRLMTLDDLIDLEEPPKKLVLDSEWEVLGADEMSEKKLASKKHMDWMKKMDCKTVRLYTKEKKERKKKVGKKKKEEEEEKEGEETLEERAERLLEEM